MFHQVRGPGLLVLGALSIGCGPRSFALGEGKDCHAGRLNCVCDSADACQSPLVCRGDLCVEPGSGQDTANLEDLTTETKAQDPATKDAPTDASSAECKKDSDCPTTDNPCVAATCQEGTCQKSTLPDNSECTDIARCIPTGRCAQGLCQGQDARFLSEDFSKGQGKWTTTSPSDQTSLWQVGVAKTSECDHVGQGEDPSEDHSPGADNMLAGTKIGGCVKGRVIRKWDCLQSPTLDISAFKGKLELSYWRQLHTPPDIVQGLPGAHYRIFAVFNKKTPVIVEEGYDAGINDSSWQRTSHILDADDSSLTVSFCFETGYGARTFAGWSLDDIRVRPQGCDPEL